MEPAPIRTYLRPAGHGIKLHLGCGDYWYENYVNIDIDTYGGTDMKWNLLEKLPFQDSVVELIESYEVIEHIGKDELKTVLADWRRVMIDGGKIRISTPDIDALIEQYPANKEKVIQYIYGFSGYQQHKWGYTEDSLRQLFEEVGFTNITITKGFLEERPEESKLILEAYK